MDFRTNSTTADGFVCTGINSPVEVNRRGHLALPSNPSRISDSRPKVFGAHKEDVQVWWKGSGYSEKLMSTKGL